MSEPVNPAPTARPRPGTVTIATYLLYLTAALFAVVAAIGFATLGTISTVFREEYAGTSAEGAEGFAVGASAFGSVVQLLIALGLVVLGLLTSQGRNGARIATWVVAGLGVCCAGLSVGGSAFSGMGAGGTTGDVPDPAVVQRRLEAELPSWSGPVTLAFSIIALLALIAAIVLLALPASNEFFRKQPVGWEPPVPGAAYPGQPPYPGQGPTAGTDPGYPQYPPAGPPSNPPGNPPTNPPPNPPAS
ncbi:hypothetical protein GCM10022225_28540 [Plantactinospora mayteni]|uniref:Uncharacterized protein n=1 Tax=Plantactinospora mayteni TaxID=566021 RepID=A0ABQ4ET99_9ACTN|nr:hypothetical protein [Plantactinospora mayteni]GIG97882.1 hypothetical protein Pma05_44550 [Plantactinospora mayteni]